MPKFAQASIAATTEDLSEYTHFLGTLAVGQVVTLPLHPGETTRRVSRLLNAAAKQKEMRITRLPSDASSVRFKVASPVKRTVRLSDEAKKARAAKAQKTRAARKAKSA